MRRTQFDLLTGRPYLTAPRVSRVDRLPIPHYSDPTYDREQTLYGESARGGEMYQRGLEYVYSDRLQQWDYNKYEAAADVADASVSEKNSPAWWETMLSAYLNKAVSLRHIIGGVNKSNGYHYYVFGYTDAETPA